MLLNIQIFSVMGSAVHVQRKSDNKKSNVHFLYLEKRSPAKFENKKIVSLLQSLRRRK